MRGQVFTCSIRIHATSKDLTPTVFSHMLVFAGITPHSPLLLDSISKDQAKHVSRTKEAMNELSDELYAVFPDTIVHICQHPTMYDNSFSINVSDPYQFDLRTFGELGDEPKRHPDIMTIDHLQRDLRKKRLPLTLSSDNTLDYSSAVPLHFLCDKLPNVKLIPITYCSLDEKAHFQFGQGLKDVLFESNKRIAVIASGDLSHALNSDSPAGFSPAGAEFDARFSQIITQKNTAGLLGMEPEILENAHQTIYKPAVILFGLLEHIGVYPQILSYEAPFGVGYLVANMAI